MAVNFSFVDPWHSFLPREGGHVVALSGSGGKTSLQRALGEFYRDQGVPVLLTCTTRTEPLAGLPVCDLDDEGGRAAIADEPLVYLRGGVGRDGKWLGLEAAAVDRLGADHPDRVVVVETDGAGKQPVKWYRDGEPVWPARTSLAIVVLGLSALEERAGDVVFRFDSERFAPLAGMQETTRWTWDHLHTLLTAEGGYVDHVPAGVPVVLALTQMGEVNDSIGLFDFMGRVMAEPRLGLAMFCETSGDEPSLRTVCREEEPPGAVR